MDIALARHHLEEWNDALNALNRVLKINPYDPRPYCNILSIYRTTGQWEKANFMLEKMEHSLKNSLPVMSAEAELALAQRQFRKAEKLFEQLHT